MRSLLLVVFTIQSINLLAQKNIQGVYTFGKADYVAFASMDGNPFILFSDGNIRGLERQGKQFVFGNALGKFDHQEGEVKVINKKSVAIKRNDKTISAEKLKLIEKKMVVKNGNVILSSELILPIGDGPFPAIVMTHGSGPETKEGNRGLAYFFALNGVATIIYDKRFTQNTETNDWEDSFDDYAHDAIAVAENLKTHAKIIQNKIGIYGHSQGGWIAPLAASKSDLFSFVIISAGNAVTPVEQHLYNGQCANRQNNVPEWAIQEIYDFRVIKYEAGITGNKVRYDSALPKAEAKPWFVRTGGGIPTSKFWKENGYYDPEPALSKLTCPVLIIGGELDRYSDTKRNMKLFDDIFSKSGNQKVNMKTIASANHALMETTTGRLDETEILELKKFASGYFETLSSWISEHVIP